MTQKQQPPLRCEVRRGGVVESVHLATVCVAEASGEIVWACGDVSQLVFPRSSLKPFQALSVVSSGAAAALGLTAEELAICCASHWGTEEHTRLVSSILAKAGLDRAALRCGAHPPLDEEAARALARAQKAPEKLHNNCSGKHAGMLATCVHMGWPTENYTDPEHPVQKLILANVCAVCRCSEGDVRVAVDGCSAPTFALPLAQVARGLAWLADPGQLPDNLRPAGIQVIQAMMAFPALVGHVLSSDSRLMAAARGWLVAKGGAEGCMAVADLRGRRGIFVKVHDGASRARAPATIAVLERLGVLGEEQLKLLSDLRRPEITNHRGDVVGEIVCEL